VYKVNINVMDCSFADNIAIFIESFVMILYCSFNNIVRILNIWMVEGKETSVYECAREKYDIWFWKA
jgi:hypothetical protein